MLNLSLIGKRISEKRKELKMTQNELAEALFVTHQAVSKWENGKSLPTIDILYELTKLFKISIDYLLDETDISSSDYESQFINYSREVVINNFLAKENWHEDIQEIFYLLNKKERFKIINFVFAKQECIEITSMWPYFNPNERIYVLGNVLSGKCDYNLNHIYHQLSHQERAIVQKHTNDGTYNYKLRHYIRS